MRHLAAPACVGTLTGVAEAVIERQEVVALLLAVYDIDATLIQIERLLRGDEDEAEEDE